MASPGTTEPPAHGFLWSDMVLVLGSEETSRPCIEVLLVLREGLRDQRTQPAEVACPADSREDIWDLLRLLSAWRVAHGTTWTKASVAGSQHHALTRLPTVGPNSISRSTSLSRPQWATHVILQCQSSRSDFQQGDRQDYLTILQEQAFM